MGRAKDWLIEQEERGWSSRPDKYVCARCFDDEALKKTVQENAEAAMCDYCGSSAQDSEDPDKPMAAPFDAVMKVIAAGIYQEWNGADSEGVPYVSAEGGYQFPTIGTYDLVRDEVPVGNEGLLRDIVRSLPDQRWCERGFYRLSPYEYLSFNWERFCTVVKYEKRYIFVKDHQRAAGGATQPTAGTAEESGALPAHSAAPIDALTLFPEDIEIQSEHEEDISPDDMLNTIGRLVVDARLLRFIPAGTRFKRARIHNAKRRLCSAETLGPPTVRRARDANRMSPAGIPMFYGALDGYTAVAETQRGRLEESKVISVAEFVSTKDFWVVDLSNLPPVPSLFSSASRHERDAIAFLHAFARDLSKPVKRDGREHIEYVPTQIVTEYFRHAFNTDSDRRVRGLFYSSSRVKMGIACVLFFDQESCGAKPKRQWHQPEQWLELNQASIHRGRGRPLRDKPGPDQRALL